MLPVFDALADLFGRATRMRCRLCGEVFPRWSTQARQGEFGMCCFCTGWQLGARTMPVRQPDPRTREVPRTTFDNAPGEQSPYIYTAADIHGAVITIRFDYDVATRAFTGPVTVYRDIDCLYHRIYIGVGDDATPDTSLKVFAVPEGTTTVTVAQLARNGINTIDDALGYQITAGP